MFLRPGGGGGCGCRGAAIGAILYIGAGCIPGAYVVAPADMPYTPASSALLLAGETPAIDMLFGEFQLLTVAGDVAGESSVFRLRLALDIGAGGAPIGSIPGACFLRCDRCFSSMFRSPSFVNGLGNTSFIPVRVSGEHPEKPIDKLTMLEVHRNVVASDVRCHGYNGRVVELTDQMSCRNAVQVRHDNVHENQVVFPATVHLVDSFQSVQLRLLSADIDEM
jgi:hypothetical protein